MVGGRSDEELVEALRDGDTAAFDELYRRYERRLFGYLRRLVDERSLAEDLFQDVFFTVLNDRTYDPQRGRFGGWLFTVARNRCEAERRRKKVREDKTPAAQPAAAADVDAATRVRAAMADLPEAQRHLLMLKQVGELTYREIASMLGVAEGTIKSRVHAATRAFRQRLAETGDG